MSLFRPCKPKGSARLSADTPITSGQHIIPVNELTWSEGDIGFVSGSGFAVGKAGLYLIIGSLSRPAISTASQMQVRIFVNGSNPADGVNVVNPSTSAAITNQVVELFPLQAGDLVQLAGTLSATLTVNARRISTKLSLARVGPERWT